MWPQLGKRQIPNWYFMLRSMKLSTSLYLIVEVDTSTATSSSHLSSSSVGSRLSHIHLLSGGILPLLSLLETTLTRHADLLELSKESRSLRVVRVQLDDGRRLIGVRYPLPLISEVASILKSLQQTQLPGVQTLISHQHLIGQSAKYPLSEFPRIKMIVLLVSLTLNSYQFVSVSVSTSSAGPSCPSPHLPSNCG